MQPTPYVTVLELVEQRLAGGVDDLQDPALQAATRRRLAGRVQISGRQTGEQRRVLDVESCLVAAGDDHGVPLRLECGDALVEHAQRCLVGLGEVDAEAPEVAQLLTEQPCPLLVEGDLAGRDPRVQSDQPVVQPSVQHDRVTVRREPGRHLLLDRVEGVGGVGLLERPEAHRGAVEQLARPLPRVEHVRGCRWGGVCRDHVELGELFGHAVAQRGAPVVRRDVPEVVQRVGQRGGCHGVGGHGCSFQRPHPGRRRGETKTRTRHSAVTARDDGGRCLLGNLRLPVRGAQCSTASGHLGASGGSASHGRLIEGTMGA